MTGESHTARDKEETLAFLPQEIMCTLCIFRGGNEICDRGTHCGCAAATSSVERGGEGKGLFPRMQM